MLCVPPALSNENEGIAFPPVLQGYCSKVLAEILPPFDNWHGQK